MRKSIIYFIVLFLVSYFVLNILYSQTGFRDIYNGLCRSLIENVCQSYYSKADISTQDFYTPSRKIDPNRMYLVYGNPRVIQQQIAEAKRRGLKEVRVSTFSTQFLFFELFFVPMAFLISLFVASPIPWRKKTQRAGYRDSCTHVVSYYKSTSTCRV